MKTVNTIRALLATTIFCTLNISTANISDYPIRIENDENSKTAIMIQFLEKDLPLSETIFAIAPGQYKILKHSPKKLFVTSALRKEEGFTKEQIEAEMRKGQIVSEINLATEFEKILPGKGKKLQTIVLNINLNSKQPWKMELEKDRIPTAASATLPKLFGKKPKQKYGLFDEKPYFKCSLECMANTLAEMIYGENYDTRKIVIGFESPDCWAFQPQLTLSKKDNNWSCYQSSVKNLLSPHSSITRDNLHGVLSQYKIHLMPKTEDIPRIMKTLMSLIKENNLQDAIHAVKFIVAYPESYYEEKKLPKVVIYCQGTENAQRVLNSMYKEFKNEGSDGREPGYNEKVNDFLFFAQGHRDSKQMNNRPYEKSMVYYDTEKLKKFYKIEDLPQKSYRLINPAKIEKPEEQEEISWEELIRQIEEVNKASKRIDSEDPEVITADKIESRKNRQLKKYSKQISAFFKKDKDPEMGAQRKAQLDDHKKLITKVATILQELEAPAKKTIPIIHEFITSKILIPRYAKANQVIARIECLYSKLDKNLIEVLVNSKNPKLATQKIMKLVQPLCELFEKIFTTKSKESEKLELKKLNEKINKILEQIKQKRKKGI